MNLLTELPLQDAPDGVIFSAAEETRKLSPWGDWILTTWRHGICWEWCVRNDGHRKVLEHPTAFTSSIRAGDGSWGDFTIDFDVRQLIADGDTSMDEMFQIKGRSGVMFRYQSFRQTYALFVECQKRVVLYRRDEEDWIELASLDVDIDRDNYYAFKIECKGDNIRCWMDGAQIFDVTDKTFRRGMVAVYSNTVSRFGGCRVYTNEVGAAEVATFISSERLAAAKSAEGLPKPVLWKTIPHPTRIPMQHKMTLDVSPDGKLSGLIVQTADHKFAPRDGIAIVSMDTEGNVRWSKHVQKDSHPRIWDLNGDGKNEVILFNGPTISLLDAETGAVLLEKPAPPCNERGNRGGRENENPYLPAYKMYPANVRGVGKGRDIVIMDVYTAFWVIDDNLDLVWWRSREHGHDVGVYDIDGDGKDEILCGYVMFDHDGKELWEMEDSEYMVFTHHHVDHIIIGEYDDDPDNGPEIAITSGNAGFFLLDTQGRIRAHQECGHAQGLTAGRYRPDLPGKQFLVGNLWGSSGVRNILSSTGEKLWTGEPDPQGCYEFPVRWAPCRDLWVCVSSPKAAGLYDGFGRNIFPLPEVAELSAYDRVCRVGDFTGNGLHDFVVQGKEAVHVFTQEG